MSSTKTLPTKTTALVCAEPGAPFKLSEPDSIILSQPQPSEALIEISAVGICQTDIGCASGELPGGSNAVYGHEGAGTVLSTGSECTHVKAGDKVLLSFYYCGECEQCLDGHPAYCYSFPLNFSGKRPDGTGTMKVKMKNAENQNEKDEEKEMHCFFFGQSSFAKYTVVHRNCIVKVPKDTRLELFAPLGCGIQTGAGAVLNTLNVPAGSSFAVFGVGSVGMAALMAAKLRQAKVIIAVDLNEKRLELAKKLGATHTVLGSDEKLVEKIQGFVKESGSKKNGVEFAVDCSGVPAVVGNMIDCLGTRGKAATVGAASPGKRTSVEVFNHLVLGREYVGCCEGDSVPSKIIPYLMEQQAAGKFPLEEMITYYDFKDFDKAINDSKEGRALKAVLKW